MADILGGLVIVALSVYFYIRTLSFPVITGYEKMGGEFWPRFTLVGIIVMAILVMIDGFLKLKRSNPSKGRSRQYGNTMGVAICGFIVFFLILLIPYIGFLLSAFLGMMVLMIAFGEKKKLAVLGYSFVMVAMIYLLFAKFLLVPLPRGVSLFETLSYYLY